MRKHFEKGTILFIVILFGIAGYLQLSIVKSTQKLRGEELVKTEQYAQKIATLIRQKTDNTILETLEKNRGVREDLNKILEAFLTKQFIYMFVLYQDANGHFRFLLDGSLKKEEKAAFKEIFIPKSNKFVEAYTTGKMQIIEQKKVGDTEDIWMTILYPILVDGKTEALLSLELSSTYANYLNTFNSPLMRIVHWMQLFLLVSMIMLIFLAYRYYHLNHSLTIDKTTAYTKYYINNFFSKKKITEYDAFLVDIDEFKDINKKYGYAFGDKLIKMFVQRMKNKLIYGSKIVASGGAEFLIFLPKTTHDFKTLTEAFYKEIKTIPYELDGHTLYLQVSMSALRISSESKLYSDVQRVLDEHLMLVKNKGKNHLKIIDDSENDKLKYGNLDYIKEAISERRICCLYQPIVDITQDKTVKYEALVRMIDRDDTSKIVSPYYFLYAIKDTSQYIKMSKMVLEDVFGTLEKYPTVQISMNLDLNDLYNAHLMEMIDKYLKKCQKISKRITFEIVEDRDIFDYEKVNAIFGQLRKYGSKVAIDDFGSGYANYAYLTKLDVDILKIDGSLIGTLLTFPERSKMILHSIKELAERLKLEVIAEFVENEEICEILKEIGITYAQGYHFGRPAPIDHYIK